MQNYSLGDWQSIDQQKVAWIQQHLIQWYEKNHRQLPWRERKNPYDIWISEVMLQQTRVETVISYFLNFMNKFPNIEILAQADEEEVLKAWEGLGYYSRARNIHRGAKMIVSDYNGQIPHTMEEIQKIPGIGPYTAGAVLSIAYGKPVPAVDGNVMRVFSRLFYIVEDIGEGRTRKEMEKLGEIMVSHRNPSFFNQGLMELGALICTPTSPKCIACPVYQQCSARKEGVQGTLPIKKKKNKTKTVELEVGFVWEKDRFLITKRPSEGLLANLWALPAVEREENEQRGKSITLELKNTYGIEAGQGNFLFEKKHIFTHLKWRIMVYAFYVPIQPLIDYPEIQWITWDEVREYAFPIAFMKVIKAFKKTDR
ncbi:A/G-specific adenine glycosylase [Clostridiaceae bacterium 35-E11]